MNLKKKRSLIDKLTGRDLYDDHDSNDFEEIEINEYAEVVARPEIKNWGVFAKKDPISKRITVPTKVEDSRSTWMDEQGDEGELSIDMHQTAESIIVRAMIPGVKKEDLDIVLTRDSLTLKGKRVEETKIADQDYFHRELYWGSFSRKVELPHEIDIEQSEATEKAGMLVLILPRIDKGRQAKLKIKSV